MKNILLLVLFMIGAIVQAQPTIVENNAIDSSDYIIIQTDYSAYDTVGFSDSIFDKVEVMPSFPGGYFEMKKFLIFNLIYPDLARVKKVSGNCIAEFIVMEDGSITNIKILKDIGGGCGAESKRLIETMPRWKPGIHYGVKVKTRVVIPINFNLQ